MSLFINPMTSATTSPKVNRHSHVAYTRNGKIELDDDFFNNVLKVQAERLAALTGSQDKLPPRAELTEEEIRQLAATYDPHHMSQREYDQFIDTLLDKGALRKEDTYFIERDGRVPINPLACGLTIGPRLPASLSDANGDLFYLAKTISFMQPDRRDSAAARQFLEQKRSTYEAISNILEKMNQVRG